MKIGIDGRAAKWYRGTGIGTYTYQLITNLSKYDNLNHYLTFIPEDSDLNLKDNFSIEYTKDSSNNNFWDDVKVPNLLENFNMELYHVPQNGVGLSGNVNCPKTITLHDIIPLRMPQTVSDRYLRIFNEEMPKILDNCDGIITVSEFSKLDIAEEFNFPKEKIFVTHLAAEDIYRPIDRAYCKKFIKDNYKIADNFILYVGGYSPRKNIIGILEAFSLLKDNLKEDLKIVITGKKGISYEIYKNKAIELGISNSVIFTDFIPLNDLPIFYNACEFLVYPSFYEGFGLPPLEAMACGVPVIASNVTSLPEVCRNSAILIDPNDIDELCYSMERVLTDSFLKLTMIERGLSTSNNYSWKNTALNTIKAYESIINF
ncbi:MULTISPECIES: glycosyltransferase family 4 protein [Clostridium]|jgi:glycosyltransferase involved in cell wall biosynthesis|uniref:Group 1 glycosyl transferase n=1 Tax=Clostridium disporicum TaxID=84024 RepID=A0A174FSP8_9CLOT|nr:MULTISPECIES: glycosyltransferase family 1 protein [Clostridium]MBX9185118.1 glycosyltransferase family 4 protein [Clostridium sp. K04]MDU3522150.1 glycosyltransferase family 1 protein [Clostridium saudiense]MDU7453946.1 glycosyltransferase family 1 protein [Clostridium saudiense]MEE0727270.1 glycosyltransferase family 1 protein [Clostridium saudiense]CUO46749.1 group 1 glycosyl transferase [Clostridium disporicum]